MPSAASTKLDTVVNLCKRRGFVYPSGEIYGGTRSAWDYGPLGVELKENIKREWWATMVRSREDMVGLDSSVILPSRVWEASGHVSTFVDPLTECQVCHHRYRADHLDQEFERRHGRVPEPAELSCPACGSRGAFTKPQLFSGLLQTHLGAVRDDGALHYLRPETAQGIFVNFANILHSTRKRPPFGIAQVGKAFRNEITPGNFIFRTREFEQMEIEFFVPPGTDEGWHEYWIGERMRWYVDLGVSAGNLRLYEHPKEKLAHYAKSTVDIEYRFGFGGDADWGELEGISNRTDFDLTAHILHSGADLAYFDQDRGERYVPYVIEPSAGLSRSVAMFLLEAYAEDEAPNARGVPEKRKVLRLDTRLAPVKVAVLPLSRNDRLSPVARDLTARLRSRWNVEFDDAAAIGRRYRRQDEIGTPYCVTIDFETLEDEAVTVRERDSMKQTRIPLVGVERYLAERVAG